MQTEIATLKRKIAVQENERKRLISELLPPDWIDTQCLGGLAPQEAWCLAVLLHRPQLSRDQFHFALAYDRPEYQFGERRADTLICKLRRKLRPYGIEIQTYYGKGFGMHAAMRAKAEAILREQCALLQADGSVNSLRPVLEQAA